jgi:hypothetical protein
MTVLKAKVDGAWVPVSSGGGGGGGGGTDEVWVNPTEPTDPNIELWFDSDAPSPTYVDRWNSAWGIVAVGSFIGGSSYPLPVGTTKITNDLPFTSIPGRRYRMVLQLRVISATTGSGINLLPLGPGVGGQSVDLWASASPGYSFAYAEVLFTGVGTSGSYYWNAAPSAVNNIYMDTMSCFYLEDCGPIAYGLPPAVDPTPAVVAWTPMPFAPTWTHYSTPFGPCSYRKVGDIVTMRGLAISTGTSTTLATLPVGYRPAIVYVGAAIMQDAPSQIRINPDGTVFTQQAVANNTWLSLNNVSFSVTP